MSRVKINKYKQGCGTTMGHGMSCGPKPFQCSACEHRNELRNEIVDLIDSYDFSQTDEFYKYEQGFIKGYFEDHINKLLTLINK